MRVEIKAKKVVLYLPEKSMDAPFGLFISTDGGDFGLTVKRCAEIEGLFNRLRRLAELAELNFEELLLTLHRPGVKGVE
jgi:hypothetical protein